MRHVLATLSALAFAASLSACGSSNEPAPSPSEATMTDMATDPNNPFAKIEMTMSEAMKAAVGRDVGDTWVRKMIEHHKGAIEMAKFALAQNTGAQLAKMAQDTIDKQTREIGSLQQLIASGEPVPASGQLYADAEMKMHSEMMGATGANFSETFFKKMLAHHKGAIALSDVALANGVSGKVRQQVTTTRSAQVKEAAMIEAMLAGEPEASPRPETAKDTAAAAAPKVVPTPRASATKPVGAKEASPTPRKPVVTPVTPSPSPSTDPHAGHDMSNMKM